MGKVIKSLNIIISLTLIFSAIGVAFIALPVFGNQALIVRSGSMEPQVGVGSIVVIRQPASLASPMPGSTPIYSIGDIIAFKSDRSSKTITTHRIVGIEVSSGQVLYTTKGDANEEADQSQVNQRNVLGRSFLTIPTIGRALAFAKSREGLPFLIILPAAIVILLELVHIIREFRKEKKRKIDTQVLRYHLTKSTSRPNWIGLKVLVPALVLGLSIPNSLAYLSDTETSANNTISAWTTNTSSIPQTGPQEIPLPPANIADHLVISEVQIDAGSNELNNHDFVEIYNPTSSPIDLNGIRLVKRTGSPTDDTIKSWTSSTLVAAHGYYLWASSADAAYPVSIGADSSTADTLAANNSVALRSGAENTGTIVDALSWHSSANAFTEGTEFSPNPGDNQSLERKALSTSTLATMFGGIDTAKGNGYDTDNNLNDFVLRSLAQPQNSTSAVESP